MLSLDIIALPLLALPSLAGVLGGGGTADTAGDADTAATHQGDHHLATYQHQDGPLASHIIPFH